jgi:hypothetical protein
MSTQNPEQTCNCTVCNMPFVKKSWNSTVCSSECRSEKNKLACRKWHIENRVSENEKARERIKLYPSEEVHKINRNFRERNGLAVLSNRKCSICKIEFLPNSHNSTTCSDSCRVRRDQCRNNTYFKNRYKSDLNFRLASIIRRRINKIVRRDVRPSSAIKGLGCSFDQLIDHIQIQFEPGMTWYNYGEWHIDHIKPLSAFDLTDIDEFNRACHYSNLQPLWAKDNLSKGAKEE